MKLTTYTIAGKKTADTDISLFDNPASPRIVAQAVRVYLSNQRAGTAKTQNRSEVGVTKSKWYKQKGTGRARHGAKNAPLFVGGSVAHGPRGNSNWKLSMSKTMRKRALETVLSLQAGKGQVVIVDGLDKLTGKTSEVVKLLGGMAIEGKAVLLVTGSKNEMLIRAAQNLSNVFVCSSDSLTTYYVARAHTVILTPEVVEMFQTKFNPRTDKIIEVKVQSKPSKSDKTIAKKTESRVRKQAKKLNS